MTNSVNSNKITAPQSEDLIKTIRLLAVTGSRLFQKYLYQPLEYAGWKRTMQYETARKMMERIEEKSDNQSFHHTIAPQCKRLVLQAMTENYAAVGDSSIFFLEKMKDNSKVALSEEAAEFVKIIEPGLKEFHELQTTQSYKIFENEVKTFSAEELSEVFSPVRLGGHTVKIKLENEALNLFNRILAESRKQDIPKCKKLISNYLIRFLDKEDNNRDEVEKLIDALEKKEFGFRTDIEDFVAIDLYYQIIRGITEKNLKKTIQGIRKYTHMFQGNPNAKYFSDIDRMEGILYKIITEKDMWKELKKD